VRLQRLAVGTTLAAALLAVTAGCTDEPRPASARPDRQEQTYRFLSSPDFLNADIGDVREDPSWRPGQPNSTNASYERALDTILGAWHDEGVRDLLVAGDLVEGHWGRDDADTGTFGPVGTLPERKAAVARAGALYYGQWRERIEQAGLVPYPAVGDHELGDNPWPADSPGYGRFKHRAFGTFLSAFGDALTTEDGRPRFASHPKGPSHRAAYSVRLAPEVLLVTVNVFQRTDADIVPKIDDQQLAWLDKVLTRADEDGVDWVIVQGHTPVLGPVRAKGSSGLFYENGADSEFWRTLTEHDVDLYLCGEVHDATAIVPDDPDQPVQVSHGGLIAYAGVNYVVGTVLGDELDLTLKRFRGTHGAKDERHHLWQTSNKIQPETVRYDPRPYVAGRLVMTSDGHVLERRGDFEEYDGGDGAVDASD